MAAVVLIAKSDLHADPSSGVPSEPPAPWVSAAVLNYLGTFEKDFAAKDLEGARLAAGAAVEQARVANDAPGEANGHRDMARLHGLQNQNEDSIAEWQLAGAAWRRAGDGPGEIEAICVVALVRSMDFKYDATVLISEAISLMETEQRRPIAAGLMVSEFSHPMEQIGRFSEALRLSVAGVTQLERLAPDSMDLAWTLMRAGVVAGLRGEPVIQFDYYSRALKIRESRQPGSLLVAESLNGLGTVAYAQLDLVAAREYLERALKIRELNAPGSLDVAQSLGNLGGVAYEQDDLAAAWDYYQRSLKIGEVKAADSTEVAGSLVGLGAVAIKRGDTVGARDDFVRALGIETAAHPFSLEVASCLGALGVASYQQGDLLGARDYLLRALAIQQKLAPDSLSLASTLSNLGSVVRSQGDLAAAQDYQQRALKIKEIKVPGSLQVAKALGNLGKLVLSQGDHVAARDYQLRAFRIRETKAPGSLSVAASLTALGEIALIQGDLDAARDYAARALAIQELEAPGSWGMAESLRELGAVFYMQGNLLAAKERLVSAWGIVRRQASAVTGDDARQAFASMTPWYSYALAAVQVALGESMSGFMTVEEGRAQALLQTVMLRGIADQAQDPSLWTTYRQAESESQRAVKRLGDASAVLERADAEVHAARSTSGPQTDVKAKKDVLAKARAEREQALSEYTRLRLEAERHLTAVRKAVPALRDDPVTIEDARGVLPPDSLWIAFAVGEEDTLVFLVPSAPGSEIKSYSVPAKQKDLAAKVASMMEKAQSRPPAAIVARQKLNREIADAGRRLYALLFPEDVRSIVDKAHELLISPDGVLWELPFSLLVSNQQGEPRWVGLEKPVSYQQSLSAYVREGERQEAGGEGVLVVGNPSFGASTAAETRGGNGSGPKRKKKDAAGERSVAPSVDWTQGERSYFVTDGKPPGALPGTEREAKEVASLYAAQPLLGSAATESAVREQIPRARVVHLATHGYFHPTMPMASGVLLAAPTKAPEIGETDADGVLQAFEFSGKLKLNADLVVLSACETGRGQKVTGEGLVGLTRSLQMDGARSVVATHWRVDDRASTDLMVAFHRKVRGGLAIDQALQQAMAEIQKKAATREPYYWAAFFLTGQRTPIAP